MVAARRLYAADFPNAEIRDNRYPQTPSEMCLTREEEARLDADSREVQK